MTERDAPLLPSDYLAQATSRLKFEDFEEAFRAHLDPESPRLTHIQMQRLWEIICDFHRMDQAVKAIRSNKVVQDLNTCLKTVTDMEGELKQKLGELRNHTDTRPHTAHVRALLSQQVRTLMQTISDSFSPEWRRTRKRQAERAAMFLVNSLEGESFTSFEKKLRKYLRPFNLSDRKRNAYVNHVIAGIMVLNNPKRRSDSTVTVLNRARQLRYHAREAMQRRPKAGELGHKDSEEFIDYVQVGSHFMLPIGGTKQKRNRRK